MPVPSFQVGPVTVYGTWDDVTDYQFLVAWGEAGDTCTVICLSGFDYGGGVTIFSEHVPYKEAEAVINDGLTEFDTKRAMEELVQKYRKEHENESHG